MALFTSTQHKTIKLDAPGSLTPAFIKLNTEGLQAILRVESTKQLAAQLKLGNTVNFVNVDGSRGKGILQAEKFVQIRFGTTISTGILRLAERALQAAISGKTKIRTGALRDLSNWSWTLLRKGVVSPLINRPGEGLPFGPGDKLLLKPSLSYASIAANRTKAPTYFKAAARILRRHSAFSALNVSVQVTRAYALADEKSIFGTRFLQITAKQGKFKRR